MRIQTSTVHVGFSSPVTWWGWLIAVYQLLRGVKFWQIVHCELMTDEGVYAYRINEVAIARLEIPDDGFRCVVRVPTIRTKTSRKYVANMLHRSWGDFTPLSVLNGNHCVRFTELVAGTNTKARLPGQLMYELVTTHHAFKSNLRTASVDKHSI